MTDAPSTVDASGEQGVRQRKASLRARIRVARRTRSEAERAEVARGLATTALDDRTISAASTVVAYYPLPGEPDVMALVGGLRARGRAVALPRITDQGLVFAEFTGELSAGGVTSSGLVIPEPTGPVLDLGQVDVMLMPALAVDRAGVRLGQGGGYYDRTDLTGVTVVAVVHDEEFFDATAGELPREPHDTVVAGVLTPSRMVWLRN